MERKAVEKLGPARITEMLGALPGWSYDATKIRIEKQFKRKDFLDAVQFINAIAPIAQAQDHHPDILLSEYNKVLVMLSTHSAGGVTQNDFMLAGAIEGIKK